MRKMTAIAQIEKTQFRNNTGGWLGVVVIDPKGNDRGVSVEPGGTVWLSAAEQQLTANAPRLAKDNPFIEQTFTRRSDETGELEDVTITPLTVLTDMRFVPADVRPIPVTHPSTGLQHAQAAARSEEPVTVTELSAGALEREHALRDAPPRIQPNEPVVPPRAAAAAAAVQETPGDPFEETAAETPASAPEETIGAATPPEGEPTPGEFQANEEVGTPVGTSDGSESTPPEQPTTPPETPGEQPAPWQG